MASIVLFTTITIVVPSSLICERRSFLFNSIKAQKADPQHFNNDKEESNRNLDKNKGQPGGHVIARSPLYWSLKSYKKHFEDVRAAQNQMHKLQNKLLTNNVIPIKIFNQLHPKQNVHLKSSEHKQEKIKVVQAESPVRKKREVVIHPQTQPEMVMQPNIQPALLQQAEARDNRPSLLFHFFNPSIYYPEVVDALSNNSGHYQDKIIEKKRDKRQILLMIKQRRPIVLTKKARTTPNPFIPETNNADYDIMKPDIYRPEVDIDNTDSYQLNEEATEYSNIVSNLYLMRKVETWPEFNKCSDKFLNPLSELLGRKLTKYYKVKTNTSTHKEPSMASNLEVNHRVKRKLDKTLIRKRRKKRKQKQRRVERKRLRMLTHARRLRKQHKSKLARLERHYARINLTKTAIPGHKTYYNETKKEVGVATISNLIDQRNDSIQSGSEFSYYDTESENGVAVEYVSTDEGSSSDYEDSESDFGPDDGNTESEEFESSRNSFEYVDYENVEDEADQTEQKDNRESNKKQVTKETRKSTQKKETL